jgi:cellulose synthase/poly-beta-1,6-N-acetylglucosamine synthase-like glycosyltransferase
VLLLALLTLALAISYALIIQQSLRAWHRQAEIQLGRNFTPTTFISVVIPARNEAAHIQECLESILDVDYPPHLYEVTVIDDHSTDHTARLVEGFSQVRLLSLSDFLNDEGNIVAYKKKAIELGVAKSKGSLIITTDADCIVSKDWLQYFAYCFEVEKAELIAGPVLFHREQNVFERFQSLDYSGMMLFTAAALHTRLWPMANGANLAYSRRIFNKVNGYEGATHLASGDDVMLVEKVFRSEPDKILFLKQTAASVRTLAKPDLKRFFSQRLRWGTKNNRFPSFLSAAVIGSVFLFSCLIILAFLSIPFHFSFFFPLFLFAFLCKTLCDYLLLKTATSFFRQGYLLKQFFISEIYHTTYIVVVGLASLLIKQYTWKGRKVQ